MEKINTLDHGLKDESFPFRPIDAHCHGIGRFDFTEPAELSLGAVEDALEQDGTRAILTLYLPIHNFSDFKTLINTYDYGRRNGKFSNIVGLALEGPLLSSHGGTPAQGVWMPNKEQWNQLAQLGAKGLKYIVLSTDADFSGYMNDEAYPDRIEWIVNTLLDGGVKPALGHFKKDNPDKCAESIRNVLEVVRARGDGPIITDHLFNDMPLNFKHAWRTADERKNRLQELEALKLETWNLDNIESKVGPVPYAILEGALEGLVKVCINFDGEHVDLNISKRVVEIIGVECFMVMTDRIQSRVLAGQKLHKRSDSSLLYQHYGIVAGGSQGLEQQICNMRMFGIDENRIRKMVNKVPSLALGIEETDISDVDETRLEHADV